ncbi:MAG: hypothetical protein HY645_06375 [Acidobacteria bacterium]|nr:hypothetical protein [Acidobacteriota bacterium]
MTRKIQTLLHRPEELVYRSCYAPVDLQEMMATAETRSRIRRLPPFHVFFGIREMEEEEVASLLPYLTQEQWRGILDLDLWSRDRMSMGQFLFWQRHILAAADPVARKLIRAADPEVWEFSFHSLLKIYPRIGEDFVGEPQGECVETPDGNYLIELPADTEKARLLRALLGKLYQLEPGWTALLLESCRHRTSIEILEAAYQNRKRRLEDLGFQDYYDAIEIYTPLPLGSTLPEKKWATLREISLLPARLPKQAQDTLLIFQAFAHLTRQTEIQPLVEELFFICNRVLSADRISAADPGSVKRAIRKAINGINLGLDCWAKGEPNKAAEGIRHHYLQSFFQIGLNHIKELQETARRLKALPPPGSFSEAVVRGLLKKYPLLVHLSQDKIRQRFFRTQTDLEEIRNHLQGLETSSA